MAALSAWLFQVETANRSLEEMDAMVEGKTMWPSLERETDEGASYERCAEGGSSEAKLGPKPCRMGKLHISRMFRT